jgi:hypothetical protein
MPPPVVQVRPAPREDGLGLGAGELGWAHRVLQEPGGGVAAEQERSLSDEDGLQGSCTMATAIASSSPRHTSV